MVVLQDQARNEPEEQQDCQHAPGREEERQIDEYDRSVFLIAVPCGSLLGIEDAGLLAV